MTKILHIDTATEVCSVSISEGEEIKSLKETNEGRSHATDLAPFIQKVLQDQDLSLRELDAVSVSMGPGSYTGLRIGVSTAKGLCYGADLPLISVPTLESMYYGIKSYPEFEDKEWYFCPVLDARRMEVYGAIFDHLGNQVLDTCAMVVESSTFDEWLDNKEVLFFGSGADKLREVITHKNAYFQTNYKHSSRFMVFPALKKLSEKEFEDVAYFEPFYLKDFITTTPKKNILFPSKKK